MCFTYMILQLMKPQEAGPIIICICLWGKRKLPEIRRLAGSSVTAKGQS